MYKRQILLIVFLSLFAHVNLMLSPNKIIYKIYLCFFFPRCNTLPSYLKQKYFFYLITK